MHKQITQNKQLLLSRARAQTLSWVLLTRAMLSGGLTLACHTQLLFFFFFYSITVTVGLPANHPKPSYRHLLLDTHISKRGGSPKHGSLNSAGISMLYFFESLKVVGNFLKCDCIFR